MRCLIVDDEKPALELLEDNVRSVSFLTHVGSCRNSFEALNILKEQQIDLIFLDIQMPGLNGLDLIRSLQNPPLIILVTAFEHHAVEAFQLNVVDYLLKPVAFSRFLLAVDKAYDLFTLRNKKAPLSIADNDHIYVNSSYSLVKIRLKQINYIEGLKDYVKIYLQDHDNAVVTRISLRDLENKLPPEFYMRVHKSFIISLDKIASISKSKLFIEGVEIPIGESYRPNLDHYISQRNL